MQRPSRSSIDNTSDDIGRLMIQLRRGPNYNQLNVSIQATLSELGNLAWNDQNLYFQESAASKSCAKQFFTALINNSEAMEQVRARLQFKKEDLKIEGLVAASCISFVTASLPGKDVCFIAVSRAKKDSDDRNLLAALDQIALNLNKSSKSRQDLYEYRVIRKSSQAFKRLIESYTHAKTRACAEYDFGALLAKLFLKHGNQLKIEGVVNCKLYEFAQKFESTYSKGYKGKSIVRTKPISTAEKIVFAEHPEHRKLHLKHMTDRQQIFMMDCCKVCQANKPTFIAILSNAQQQGEILRAGQSPRRPLKLSAVQEESLPATSLYGLFHEASSHDQGELTTSEKKPQLSLIEACAQSKHHQVARHIKEKSDVNAKDTTSNTAVHYAVQQQNPRILQMLLQVETLRLNPANREGYTPLHIAVLTKNAAAVAMLVQDKRLRVNIRTKQLHASPLVLAVQLNDKPVLEALLVHSEIDLDQPFNLSQEGGDTTPLGYAWHLDNKEAAVILLQHGAKIDCLSPEERTALFAYATSVGSASEVSAYFNTLKQAIMDQTIQVKLNDQAMTKLFIKAIKNDDVEFLKTAYANNNGIYSAGFSLPGRPSFTLLHLAVRYRSLNTINEILSVCPQAANKKMDDKAPTHLSGAREREVQEIFLKFN